jgi:hypothetical protein
MSFFDGVRDPYVSQVLAARGIPAQAVASLRARNGVAIAEGKTLHEHHWFEPNGERWGFFVISLGGKTVTCWMERG